MPAAYRRADRVAARCAPRSKRNTVDACYPPVAGFNVAETGRLQPGAELQEDHGPACGSQFLRDDPAACSRSYDHRIRRNRRHSASHPECHVISPRQENAKRRATQKDNTMQQVTTTPLAHAHASLVIGHRDAEPRRKTGHEFHEAAEPQPKVKSHPTELFGVRQLAAALVRMECSIALKAQASLRTPKKSRKNLVRKTRIHSVVLRISRKRTPNMPQVYGAIGCAGTAVRKLRSRAPKSSKATREPRSPAQPARE